MAHDPKILIRAIHLECKAISNSILIILILYNSDNCEMLIGILYF